MPFSQQTSDSKAKKRGRLLWFTTDPLNIGLVLNILCRLLWLEGLHILCRMVRHKREARSRVLLPSEEARIQSVAGTEASPGSCCREAFVRLSLSRLGRRLPCRSDPSFDAIASNERTPARKMLAFSAIPAVSAIPSSLCRCRSPALHG